MGSNLFCLLVSYNLCSIPYFCILRFPGQIWSPLYLPYLKQRAKSRCWWERGESQGQRVLFEGYYASLRIQEWFFLGIAGLEPATIRLKAQCSTNWAIHPILQEGLVRKRKEGGLAPFLLIISQGRGSVWGSYCGASLGILSTHWGFYLKKKVNGGDYSSSNSDYLRKR